MKAYPLTWNYPDIFSNHIILIGTFHLTMSYFKVIGKKMEATGLTDILMEAGLVGSGTIGGIMSGKNYSRAMACHKTVLEALERLTVVAFLESRNETSVFESIPVDSKVNIESIKLTCLQERRT